VCAIAVLLVVGAALEFSGIALVGWDVLEANRTFKDMARPDWLDRQSEESRWRSLQALMAEVAAGNIWRRALGVGLFASGLLMQTFANVAAL
jgi:hypothetical protein